MCNVSLPPGAALEMALRAALFLMGLSMSFLTNTFPAETDAHKAAKMTGAAPATVPQNRSLHVLDNAGAASLLLAVSVALRAGDSCCAFRGESRRIRPGGTRRSTEAKCLTHRNHL